MEIEVFPIKKEYGIFFHYLDFTWNIFIILSIESHEGAFLSLESLQVSSNMIYCKVF